MLFGEKYPDPVRMVSMGKFSKELCGGTHLTSTDQVGPFEIISEEGVSAGTRRVVALTGERAQHHREQTTSALTQVAELLQVGLDQVPAATKSLAEHLRHLKKKLAGGSGGAPAPAQYGASTGTELDYQQQRSLLREAARQLNVAIVDLPGRIASILEESRALEAQIAAREQAGGTSADELIADSTDVGGVKVIVAELPMAGSGLMRQLIDQIRKSVEPSAILFASREGEGKVTLVAAVSRDLVRRKISAGNWVKEVAPIVGGGGGGKPDMAQAGGKMPEKTPEALEKASRWIHDALTG